MTHWKLTLAYTGHGFHGWQIQPGLVTVQGTLSQALHRITGESVLPQGAGRTDTGVHALAQVCSFALRAPLPATNLQRALNRVLPASIRVLSAEPASPDFHARHSSRGKFYEYRIFERRPWDEAGGPSKDRICSPFLAPFVWDCRWPLQWGPLQEAAQLILGTHDFSSMAASSGASSSDGENAPTPNPVKTIYSAGWTHADGLLCFRIRGSGFLHHMVRNLVGTLVDIGRGSRQASDMRSILASRDRSLAGPTAPASGLHLLEVLYPSEPQPAHAATGERLMELVP